MDRQMDGRMDIQKLWLDGQEKKQGWVDRKKNDGWMDRKDSWMVGCIVKNRWMGGRKDNKQMDGWTDFN